jgi:hypothetical protein
MNTPYLMQPEDFRLVGDPDPTLNMQLIAQSCDAGTHPAETTVRLARFQRLWQGVGERPAVLGQADPPPAHRARGRPGRGPDVRRGGRNAPGR